MLLLGEMCSLKISYFSKITQFHQNYVPIKIDILQNFRIPFIQKISLLQMLLLREMCSLKISFFPKITRFHKNYVT